MSSNPSRIEVKRAKEIDEEDMISIEKKTTLRCANCDRKLISLILLKERVPFEVEQIYQCNCPFCGDKSFKKSLFGRVAVNSHDEKRIVHSNTESDVKMDDSGKLESINNFLTVNKK